MTNVELIDKLRTCNGYSYITCRDCPFNTNVATCQYKIKRAAADALEAAEKKIEELERGFINRGSIVDDLCKFIGELKAQIPKEGEWIDGGFSRGVSDKITKAWEQYIEREKVAEKIAVKEDFNRRRHELEELKRMANDE